MLVCSFVSSLVTKPLPFMKDLVALKYLSEKGSVESARRLLEHRPNRPSVLPISSHVTTLFGRFSILLVLALVAQLCMARNMFEDGCFRVHWNPQTRTKISKNPKIPQAKKAKARNITSEQTSSIFVSNLPLFSAFSFSPTPCASF